MGDTDLTPDAGKSSASRQTFVSGRARSSPAKTCVRRSCAWATSATPRHRARRREGEIRLRDAGAERRIDLTALDPERRRRRAARRRPLRSADQAARRERPGHPLCDLRLRRAVRRDARSMSSSARSRSGASSRAHDVGRVINPIQVEGQIHGGIAQGLGMALMEEYLPGVTENLHDYLIPDLRRSAADRDHPDRGSGAARPLRRQRASASRP